MKNEKKRGEEREDERFPRKICFDSFLFSIRFKIYHRISFLSLPRVLKKKLLYFTLLYFGEGEKFASILFSFRFDLRYIIEFRTMILRISFFSLPRTMARERISLCMNNFQKRKKTLLYFTLFWAGEGEKFASTLSLFDLNYFTLFYFGGKKTDVQKKKMKMTGHGSWMSN